MFAKFHDSVQVQGVKVANGELLAVRGGGDVVFQVGNGIKNKTVVLKDVLWVPELTVCLLSVPTLQRIRGVTVLLHETGATIADGNNNKVEATLDWGSGVNVIKARSANARAGAITFSATAGSGSLPEAGSSRTAGSGSLPEAEQEALDTDGSSESVEANPVDTGQDRPGLSTTGQDKRLSRPEAAILLWHRRLGHIGIRSLRALAQKVKEVGIPFKIVERVMRKAQVCDSCVEGKMTRLPFPQSQTRSDTILQLVHVDLLGPVRTANPMIYVMVIVDDFSRKAWSFPLFAKSDAFQRLREWATMQHNQTDRKIKTIRTDGGGEFASTAMEHWSTEQGIARQLTAPYTSVQNGVVERVNRTLQDRMRAMMHGARSPPELWSAAFLAATYQYNRSPNTAIGGALPEFKWSGKDVDLSMLRVWGCVAWVKIHPQQRVGSKTLAARAARGMFLGYTDNHKAWHVWTPGQSGKQMHFSRDVRFDEGRLYWDTVLSRQQPGSEAPQEPDEIDWTPIVGDEDNTVAVDVTIGDGHVTGSVGAGDGGNEQGSAANQDVSSVGADVSRHFRDGSEPLADVLYDLPLQDLLSSPLRDEEPPVILDALRPTPTPDLASRIGDLQVPQGQDSFRQTQEPSFVEDRPARVMSERELRAERRHISRFGHANLAPGITSVLGQALSASAKASIRVSSDGIQLEPMFRHEALRREDWPKWKIAEEEQIKSLLEMKTWELVRLPPGRKAIGSRWVYKLKLDEHGKAARWKARLVAQGFSQVPGQDYTETYAPTARLDTVRFVLVVAVYLGLLIHQVDVIVAYLRGKLKDEIYMRPPPGYGPEDVNLVCRLLKPLYGLKQAGKAWNDAIHAVLHARGYRRCKADRCLYVKKVGAKIIIILIYVDDLLICAPTIEIMQAEKAYIKSKFDITDGGEVKHFLGIKVTRDPSSGTLFLSQKAYIEATLARFGMDKESGSRTPLPSTVPRRSTKEDVSKIFDADATKGYAQIVGCIKWIAATTRPDLIFAAGMLGRFQSAPNQEHQQVALQVLRYLRKTSDYVFVIKKPSANVPVLTGFCDADYAGDLDTRRSTTGFVYYVLGNPVTWSSRLQPTVALSTMEAEYMAVCEGMREGLWLKTLLGELGLWRQDDHVKLFTDNDGCRSLATTSDDHRRARHIDVTYHAVRDAVEDGRITVERIGSDDNPSDVCTKPFTGSRLQDARTRLHLVLDDSITDHQDD